MGLEVICVGAVTLDTVASVEQAPPEDGRAVAGPFQVAGGGPAATAAVALARLGIPVGFCGVVGDDEAGRLSRRLLDEEGVDTRWLRTVPGVRTTQSMIVVSRATGSRTIVTSPSTPPDPDAVPVSAAAWLHVDQTGYASARAALGVRGGGPRLSVDGGNPIAGLDVDGVALYAPTVGALCATFPAADLVASMRLAAAAGASRVVATAGGDGCHLLVDGEAVHIPPFAVDPVSTMGAGDAFHGALLAGLVEGRTLVDAARRANAVAALSCRALDGRGGIPDAEETEHYLATRTRLWSPGPTR